MVRKGIIERRKEKGNVSNIAKSAPVHSTRADMGNRGRAVKQSIAEEVNEVEAVNEVTEQKQTVPSEVEIMKSLEFKRGEHTLSLRLSRKKGKHQVRIQVFLNNEMEIRPVSYMSETAGGNFWRLLTKDIDV